MRLAFLVTVLIAFTTWSLIIVAPEGLPGLFTLLKQQPWGQQVFVDLCISLSVAWLWLIPEAKARGINPWPYLLITPSVGSIALLSFLVHRELVLRRAASQPATS